MRVTVSEELMSQLKVAALREYVPDEGNYLSKLPKDWTGDDVRNHFSNSLRWKWLSPNINQGSAM